MFTAPIRLDIVYVFINMKTITNLTQANGFSFLDPEKSFRNILPQAVARKGIDGHYNKEIKKIVLTMR